MTRGVMRANRQLSGVQPLVSKVVAKLDLFLEIGGLFWKRNRADCPGEVGASRKRGVRIT